MKTLVGILAATTLSLWSSGVSLVVASEPTLDERVLAVEDKVIAWRRDIHANPELGNREFRTSKLVAEHLESLGMEVRTGIAVTGVVGVLQGAGPGPVLALRADMDALPVLEQTGLSFASKATGEYNGRVVPVMHACGHDAHTAMLMGAAEVLSGLRAQFNGTVLFVFQPAEEGAPEGETGGSARMLAEGVFDDPRPDAIFGLHVEPGVPGSIHVRPGGFLASATSMRIRLSGRQTHAARPWEGTDLINLTADIVKALTTYSARQVDVFDVPNVITVATIDAGVRGNILPGEATMTGTIRTYSNERREVLKSAVKRMTEGYASFYGATAVVEYEDVASVTGNDPDILELLMPALEEAAGDVGVDPNSPLRGAAEDFSFFEEHVPGIYYILGSTPPGADPDNPPTNHSPQFDIDERVLQTGVRAHVLTTLRFLGHFRGMERQ